MQKFHALFGKIVLRMIGFISIIVICIVINDTIYQAEKEEIFLEAWEAFDKYYEVERDNIFSEYGLKAHEHIMQSQYNQRYEI